MTIFTLLRFKLVQHKMTKMKDCWPQCMLFLYFLYIIDGNKSKQKYTHIYLIK